MAKFMTGHISPHYMQIWFANATSIQHSYRRPYIPPIVQTLFFFAKINNIIHTKMFYATYTQSLVINLHQNRAGSNGVRAYTTWNFGCFCCKFITQFVNESYIMHLRKRYSFWQHRLPGTHQYIIPIWFTMYIWNRAAYCPSARNLIN